MPGSDEEPKRICLVCKFWKQFSISNGFCDKQDNWYDETTYNHVCDKFEREDDDCTRTC